MLQHRVGSAGPPGTGTGHAAPAGVQILGILVMLLIFNPKNLSTTVKIRKTRNITTNPTIDAVIIPLAPSIPALSPPENIHFNAPKSRKNSAITTAITKKKVIAADIIPGTLSSVKQRMSNGAPGHPISAAGVGVGTAAAKAKGVSDR